MKIGIIASLYDPYTRGGAEVFVSNIVGELKKEHDLFVITIDEWRGFRSLFPRVEMRHGVRVYRFYPLNIFSFIDINEKPFIFRALWGVFDLFNVHSMCVVASIIRKEKSDTVMVHALKGLSYGIASLLNFMKIKWMFTPHDVQLVVPSGRLLANREGALYSPMTQLYTSFTKACIGSPTWTIFSSRFLERFYSDKGFFKKSERIILSSPAPALPAQLFRNRGGHSKTFLYVGQLEVEKGVLDVISAFRELPYSDVRLTIMGSGSLEEQIKEACARDVRMEFVGYKQGEEKFQVFAQCDYVVVCSRIYENSPSVVYEAFSLGIPVVTIDLGGAAELVKDGENGFVYEVNTPHGLRNALERAYEEQQYSDLSRNARAAVSLLTLENYTQKLSEYIVSSERS